MATIDTEARGVVGMRNQSVPAEGEDGLFTQQWFPVCLSSEVEPGKIHGADFLDGRVIVVRDEAGVATVLSAYCAHLGVDLSIAAREGQKIQCPFHFWEYDTSGACVGTGVKETPPRNARLYRFPTQEMYGIIFAFNGEAPTYDLPTFDVDHDRMVFKSGAIDMLLPIDPWVVAANTPDLSHTVLLHGMDYVNDPFQEVKWTDNSVSFGIHARIPEGQMFEVGAAIHGTNYFFQQGDLDGRWFGWAAPFGLPRPGQTKVYFIIAALPEDDETPEQTDEFLDYALGIEMRIAGQDMPLFQGIHYRPRGLTRSDRVLARFFEYVRRYPRAHPSADFIR